MITEKNVRRFVGEKDNTLIEATHGCKAFVYSTSSNLDAGGLRELAEACLKAADYLEGDGDSISAALAEHTPLRSVS